MYQYNFNVICIFCLNNFIIIFLVDYYINHRIIYQFHINFISSHLSPQLSTTTTTTKPLSTTFRASWMASAHSTQRQQGSSVLFWPYRRPRSVRVVRIIMRMIFTSKTGQEEYLDSGQRRDGLLPPGGLRLEKDDGRNRLSSDRSSPATMPSGARSLAPRADRTTNCGEVRRGPSRTLKPTSRPSRIG